jgi:hypothetical protein
MIPVNGSSFGRAGGRLRRYPGGTITPKGYLLPEFYSGATGLTGRFNEGFLLRRLQFRVIQGQRLFSIPPNLSSQLFRG